MKYFNKEFFTFFDGLKKNNNKEWFDKNRSIYEQEVKLPFRQLVEDITAKMTKDLPELNQNISKAIFRINRDIRFAKDKSPYKTNVGAILSRTGTKDQIYPAFICTLGLRIALWGAANISAIKKN
ncbi:MAG: TIGR02453 family protein [Bacteroidetes bacterium]|nr:TIGR02453 family protein [Bacteroidota bacterium]